MIAKPTLKTIPIAILLVFIVAVLGWMFGDNQNGAPQSKRASQDKASASSEPRSCTASPRSKLKGLRPANIDVQQRLQALYQKYPELNIPTKDPEKDLTELYTQLFSEGTSNELNSEIAPFVQMLEGKTPWEPQAARHFLTKYQNLLGTLIENSSSDHYFQGSDSLDTYTDHFHPAVKFLTTSFALQAKLGETDHATKTYQVTQHILSSTQHDCLFSCTIVIITRMELNQHVLTLSAQSPEIATTAIKPSFNNPISFPQLLIGEFSAGMKLTYQESVINPQGEIVCDVLQDGYLVNIDIIEDAMATNVIRSLQKIRQFEQSEPNATAFDELLTKLETPDATDHQTSATDGILQTLFFSPKPYYRSTQKLNFTNQTQQTALQIALAQSRGETFTGELPRHYKTGKPIVWDQENNLLLTGLEDKSSTIKIPTIPPPKK